MSAADVRAGTASVHEAGAGSTPSPALKGLIVAPISIGVAKELIVRHHYLHSLPGGTKLALGVFAGSRLMGALILGVGPALIHSLVKGASPDDCLTLTRLWLSNELPRNSESKVIGMVLRELKKNTHLKFIVSCADPSAGHLGIIYQATNWIYTGLSQGTPLYDIGDGRPLHSRSLSHIYGTHSLAHFASKGVKVRLVTQARKHRYVFFLYPSWRSRLLVPVLPYPKKEDADGSHQHSFDQTS